MNAFVSGLIVVVEVCYYESRLIFHPSPSTLKVIAAYGDSCGSGGAGKKDRDAPHGRDEGKEVVDAPHGSRKSPIGPAMPSAAVLAQAQRAAEAFSERVSIA